MDPDETLKQLRALASKLKHVQQTDDEDNFLPDQADLAQEYADLFSALDEWLSKGGFLPKAWAHQGVERSVFKLAQELHGK
jgi:hypothetical protein